jgi:glycosyltransferase involved in cell wall biosynthesis
MSDIKYSVLMSIYYKEKPEYLKASLNSIFNQTIKPSEVILVKDGPITKGLEDVIDEYLKKYNTFYVYELEENRGLGHALNHGLKHCSNEVVFRMDTDDISLNDRARIQLEYLNEHPDISVLGSYIEEFQDENNNSLYIKQTPLSDTEIKKMFKKKNAMNHPSIVFKKSDVLAVGGYIELKLNEDYYLWVRMAEKGYTFANIGEPLVRMRVSDETYLRRGGLNYFLVQNSIYKNMKRTNHISLKDYVQGYFIRFIFRVVLTNKLRKWVYTRLLRKGIS